MGEPPTMWGVLERGLLPALREGRQAAREVDAYLMGSSLLPR